MPPILMGAGVCAAAGWANAVAAAAARKTLRVIRFIQAIRRSRLHGTATVLALWRARERPLTKFDLARRSARQLGLRPDRLWRSFRAISGIQCEAGEERPR